MNFEDLRAKNLKQEIRKLHNKKTRWQIWSAMNWLSYEGDKSYLEQIGGITPVESLDSVSGYIDCVEFAIGHKDISLLVPGVLQHSGIPQAGDIIIYGRGLWSGYGLKHPTHVGVWQNDGKVISKWGDHGPVMHHEWDKVVPDFGAYAFFSTYKGKILLD